jgi:hypothetical protein
VPATVEALIIALVFVMPGFVAVRTREALLPGVAKADVLQLTLRSITVSLLFLPLWLIASPDLLDLRRRLAGAVEVTGTPAVAIGDRGVVIFFALAVVLPTAAGIIWAVGYWQDWYPRIGSHLLPRLGIPAPNRGVGEDLWDRLWLSARRQMWLTVYTKAGPIYFGRGVEFGYSSQGRDVYLGGDTRVYDGHGTLVREMRAGGGVGVWIPASEVASIEIYDPPLETA